jgi:hypothetical protein
MDDDQFIDYRFEVWMCPPLMNINLNKTKPKIINLEKIYPIEINMNKTKQMTTR